MQSLSTRLLPGASVAPAPGPRPVRMARGPLPCSASSGSTGGPDLSDLAYLGKAFADTVADRVGSAVAESLAKVQKAEAERKRFLQDFEEEVRARAREEAERAQRTATGAASYSSGPGDSKSATTAPPKEVGLSEAVDDLRAKTASARAKAQALRTKMGPTPPVRRNPPSA